MILASAYIDVSNVAMNGGFGMRYDALRDFATRNGYRMLHMNAYVGYDRQRAASEQSYSASQQRFHNAIKDFGFKVVVKDVKHFRDEDGKEFKKSNVDIDMTVDLLMSKPADRIVICTGDGDFIPVIKALQERGSRVEVVGFENVSKDLKSEADLYICGWIIPGLMPCAVSRERGVCYYRSGSGGMLRVMDNYAEGMVEVTDSHMPRSAYASVQFDDKDLVDLHPSCLPSRSIILEFTVQDDGSSLVAKDIRVVSKGA